MGIKAYNKTEVQETSLEVEESSIELVKDPIINELMARDLENRDGCKIVTVGGSYDFTNEMLNNLNFKKSGSANVNVIGREVNPVGLKDAEAHDRESSYSGPHKELVGQQFILRNKERDPTNSNSFSTCQFPPKFEPCMDRFHVHGPQSVPIEDRKKSQSEIKSMESDISESIYGEECSK